MRNLHIEYLGSDQGFMAASLRAKEAAKENQMKDPASRPGISAAHWARRPITKVPTPTPGGKKMAKTGAAGWKSAWATTTSSL